MINSTTGKYVHLNGHTLGFHSETEDLEPPCTTSSTAQQELKLLNIAFISTVKLKDFNHRVEGSTTLG